MKALKFISVFISSYFIVMPLSAQNFTEDYKKIQANYAGAARFYCEVKMSMYDQRNAMKPTEVYTTVVKKQGKNYLTVTGKNIVLSNEICDIQVNQQEKRILYAEKEEKHADKGLVEAFAVLDTLIKKRNDSIAFEGITEGKKKYTVYSTGSAIVKTELFIDAEKNLLSKLIYFYGENKMISVQKVMIEYEHVNFSPEFSKGEFSEKKYIVYVGKTVKPTTEFINYKLTDISSPKSN
jgi:hypothetical protein